MIRLCFQPRWSTPVLVALSLCAPLSAQDELAPAREFVRGSMNGVRPDISDVISMTNTIFDVFSDGGIPFRDCSGELNLDAADVNDNEHFTLADPLLLILSLTDVFEVPAPFPDCGAGFEGTDRALGCDEVPRECE